ncbi:Structural maintenance of chromosomes protein 1 [Platanthera guangdongensis]|uniref:Structural maintenance of chromosomes protein 1 n=1 Tax=Platanthera guangdongensis TaxID=2320717 RepID=A0ABR2ML89_9ASPA
MNSNIKLLFTVCWMLPKILRLELENFKSYKGRQVIGPFYDFTAIIGPNDSDKSNLMDAISFVLDVRSTHLRGAQLRDLIYAADDREKEQRGRKAFVQLVYQMGNGSELVFTRAITGAGGSEYKIDHKIVNWDDYSAKLKSLGILVKARNFLVFQKKIPSISPEVQLAPVNDSQAPLIPIIAKEDEDAPEQDLPAQTAASGCPIPVVVPPTIPNLPRASVEPDIAAAASAAFTAIMRSNEEGSLIDRDLLIKLLCDPSMLEKLASEHAIPKQAQLPAQLPPTAAHPDPILALIPAPNLDSQPLCSPRVTITRATAVPVNSLPAKDVNYYKSLIQKHGGDRHEMTELAPPHETSHEYHSNPLGSIYREGGWHEQKQNESRKPRTGKPCAYFNTTRGCRQGASCSYLHDSSPSTNSYLQTSSKNMMQRPQGGAKRIKFDR